MAPWGAERGKEFELNMVFIALSVCVCSCLAFNGRKCSCVTKVGATEAVVKVSGYV